MVMTDYEAIISGVSYKLKFKNGMTIILGDSGNGKTLLYNRFVDESVFDKRIKCLNFKDNGEVLEKLKKFSNNLIVIDNGDIILGKKEKEFISKDKINQYIIFCRNLEGLPIGWSRVARFRRENSKIELNYFMRPNSILGDE